MTKKNKSILRNIRKMLASGRSLGSLLVGLAATAVGCQRDHSPADVMGSYPNTNVRNEGRDCHVRGKYITREQPETTNQTNTVPIAQPTDKPKEAAPPASKPAQ